MVNNSKIKKIEERRSVLKKIAFMNLGAKECKNSRSGLDLICMLRNHSFIYNQFKKTISRCVKNEVIPVLEGHLSEDKINLIRDLTGVESAGATFESLCDSRNIDKDGSILKDLMSKGLDLEVMNGFNTCLKVFFSNFGWLLDESCYSASNLTIQDVHCILTYMDSEYRGMLNVSEEKLEDKPDTESKEKDSRREEIRDISNMFFV